MSVWGNGKWQYKFKCRGKQYRARGFTSQREAILAEARRRVKLGESPAVRGIPGDSLQEIATEYLNDCRMRMRSNTVRQKRHVFKEFLAHLGSDLPAADVTQYHVEGYIQAKALEAGNKAANRHLRDLSALFSWADLPNPCRRTKKYPEERYVPYVPPAEDIAKVRLAAQGDERDFIETLYFLAARRGEIARLTWEDVNLEQAWVRLWTRKRRGGELEEDCLPTVGSLRTILQRRWRHRDKESPYVFQLPLNQLRYMMDRLCRQAGVKRFGFHAIRHHVASIMADRSKASLKQIQSALRHRRQGTTETYLHLIEQGLADAFEALENEDQEAKGCQGCQNP